MHEEKTHEAVMRYHERTKHNFHRYAKSLGYMDWKSQPDPFRSYSDLERVALPLLSKDPPAAHMDLYLRRNNQFRPFELENVAGFLELSLGLSAWKALSGARWSLRINPSSGNLHPTECHLVLPPAGSTEGGVYHYNPFLHSLERRAKVPYELWKKIFSHFKCDGFLVGLSSIFWRESWKYGERAFRYCNHDVGHALACLSFSANLQGWKVKYLNSLSDKETEVVLGFDKVEWVESEEEYPELLCYVCENQVKDVPRGLSAELISSFAELSFKGKPNVLSRERIHWEIIYEAAFHTRKPATDEKRIEYGPRGFLEKAVSSRSASQIIRQRRSAVAFSESGFLTREQFFTILDKTLPRDDCSPFDLELMEPAVNLLLFVHAVAGLDQGLYLFFRNKNEIQRMKNACSAEFLWDQVMDDFPLYLLEKGNYRRTAAKVSCGQEIAGDCVFSLGMVAGYRDIVMSEPHRYRHLHWEAGMIGQVLYLEAEAHGVRGTGMGCFFDDPVHDIMGFRDNTYQSLYHFAIGKPVEDSRLTTYPPYAHSKKI